MTLFETLISAGSIIIALCCIWYVRHIVRTSGRDRPRNPERVWRLIEKVRQD
jgi:hypothetical protein